MLLLAYGCVNPSRYIRGRANDAADPFRANLSVGSGIHLNVNATRAAALGAGRCEVTRIGIRRGQWGAWRESRWDINPILPLLGDTRIQKCYFGYVDGSTNRRRISFAESFPTSMGDRTRGAFEVSANLHLLLPGAEVGFDAAEVLDFALGLLGVDLMNDDVRDPFEQLLSPAAPDRLKGVQKLAYSTDDHAVNALVVALCDAEPLVRIEALRTIMFRRETAIMPAIAIVLDDPNLAVRTQAAAAMSHLAGVPFREDDPVGQARTWWAKKGKKRFTAAPAEYKTEK